MFSKIIFFVFVWGTLAKHEEYEGQILYSVNVDDIDQAKLLNDLETHLNLDIWSHALPGRPGSVLVSKEMRTQFEGSLESIGVKYDVEVENIKEKLDLEDQLLSAATARSNRTSARLSFDTIHRYDVVNAYLEELANIYPETVTLVTAGRSIEGREIRYLKISSSNFQDTSKPIVMMESLLHAREWVTLPATLYAIHKLVVDVTEQDLIRDIDWIILPIANPDGYEHTHTTSRFWRKNRATGFIVGNICSGVDLNRNFDIFWGTASSASVCLDTFHGNGAFSEPETTAIRNIILEHVDRLELFLDIHSFGSMILFGYGNGILPANALTVNLVGVLMAQAIDAVKLPSNPNYIVGNVFMVLYAASGSAGDFAQSVGVPLSYTYELPGYRNLNTMNGFLVDPDFIEQAGFETWRGISIGARYALNNYRMKHAK